MASETESPVEDMLRAMVEVVGLYSPHPTTMSRHLALAVFVGMHHEKFNDDMFEATMSWIEMATEADLKYVCTGDRT